MDLARVMETTGYFWSPLTFAGLAGLAVLFLWLAFAPAGRARPEGARLDQYLERGDLVQEEEVARPFAARVLFPMARGVLRLFGRFAPKGNAGRTQRMLVEAGEPGGLTPLDFVGLRLLLLVILGAGYFWLAGRSQPFGTALRNALILAVVGYILPYYWLRRRARIRKHEIARALPDALDMMTIGVEAGLGFDAAMLKVGERWDNALTRELRRAVAEMRVGTPRDAALQRVAERTGVEGLQTFVSVLNQSSQLGVSVAKVLHAQAAEQRVRRRQRAEELARQAGGKMVFPLVFFIFPAIFVVVLGPAIPGIISFFSLLRSSAVR